jgi:hypothetical protein
VVLGREPRGFHAYWESILSLAYIPSPYYFSFKENK